MRSRQNQMVALGANSLLAGATAGVRRYLHGSSFWDGFARGAFGGAVSYAGRRVSGERFAGAGLLGREVAAVGASMVVNASEGRGLLETVTLPIGPLRLHVDRSAPRPLQAKLDLAGVVAIAYVATQASSVDWRSSLSSGAPVFVVRDQSLSGGRQIAGVVQLRDDTPDVMEESLAHERIHVAQYDFASLVWNRPAERALLHGSPSGSWVSRHLDLGLHLPVQGILNLVVPYQDRPWEWEAHVLSNTQPITSSAGGLR
jgi:hypothetical protein